MPPSKKSQDERIAEMKFSSVYPHYVAKVEKKGRTEEELHQVIRWLTGFNKRSLQKHIKDHNGFVILNGMKYWTFSNNPDIIGRRKA